MYDMYYVGILLDYNDITMASAIICRIILLCGIRPEQY